MSLKRPDIIAWAMLLLAAFLWTFGRQQMSKFHTEETNAVATTALVQDTHLSSTTVTMTEATLAPTTAAGTMWTDSSPLEETTSPPTQLEEHSDEEEDPGGILLGVIFYIAAAAVAGAAVFLLRQKKPVLGPDGLCILWAVLVMGYYWTANMEYILWTSTFALWFTASGVLLRFAILLTVRELWGWLLGKLTLSWCMVHRIAVVCKSPQALLLVFVGWILLAPTGILFGVLMGYGIPVWFFLGAACFGLLCLWRYGADLNHFKQQLNHYQQGQPITVGNGAFAQTEAQLLNIQAQHEEAVRTAVTGERFKVELISNVSHDLRTPLTSILGYSELLQKEKLSPQGQEQLRRLHLKAGYMSELVESLFELTKVSSGVVESKKEEIDLIRLLEQTVGFFDDQLTAAELCVRRHYSGESATIVTDGARMHQVFANLLGNAIKYALAGTRIHLEVKETANGYLVRMVNTASYEMDFQPNEIMQRFARGDKARTTKGSGLGLAIAQTYTESVGGTFRVCVDGDQFSAIVELPKNERNL